jgi:hypothetical protein
MSDGTTGTTTNGTLTATTLEEMLRVIRDFENEHPAPMMRFFDPPSLFGMRVVESPLVPTEEHVEYYYGRGGYKNRWLVSKSRIVRRPKVLISPMLGTMFINPRDSAIIRNLIT